MRHIKKGDLVKVIAGNHKGKEGKVLKILSDSDRIIVEKVNLVKRHSRPSKKNQAGGIIEKEGSINISNVKLVCPRCSKPARTGVVDMDDKRVRKCKECGEIVDK